MDDILGHAGVEANYGTKQNIVMSELDVAELGVRLFRRFGDKISCPIRLAVSRTIAARVKTRDLFSGPRLEVFVQNGGWTI